MVKRPDEMRWAIVRKWKSNLTVSAIAKEEGCAKRTAKLWIDRYQATGGVKDLPRSGRRPCMDEATQRIATYMLLSDNGGAAAVSSSLVTSGATPQPVHKTTIIRTARRVARAGGFKIKALRGKPTKKIPAVTVQKRLGFCVKNLARTWGSVMFTDRKKFAFRYPGSKVFPVTWVKAGEKREANNINHASVVNVYAGVTRFGMTKLHVVAGTTGHKSTYMNKKGAQSKNITAAEYRDVVAKTLLPEGRRLFSGAGISTWVLQQDNDPTHKVAGSVVSEYNKKNDSSIGLLQGWPPNSPDLSLIENVWAFLDAKMDSLGLKTFSEYKAALVREAKAVPKEFCQNLFAGMHKRLQSCMERGGQKTMH